jgi:hypothetical protein
MITAAGAHGRGRKKRDGENGQCRYRQPSPTGAVREGLVLNALRHR